MYEAPSLVIWLSTARCNMACRHCYVRGRFGGPELTTEEALRMVRELPELGAVHLAITGGEPFLRPDVLQVAREAVEHGLKVSFNTNGSLINERLAKELRKLDALVFISLDGADRDVCDALRGPGAWKKALRGLAELRSYGVEYSVIMTITALNYWQGKKHIMLCEAVGAWDAIFLPLIPSGMAAKAREELMPSPSQVVECLKAAEEAVEEIGYRASIWCAPFASRFLRSKRLYVAPCSEGIMDISPQGDLLFCDTLDFKAGNVRDGVARAWEIFLAFREKLVAGRAPWREPPCSECPAVGFCEGGCLARAYLTWRDLGAPDPLCPHVASWRARGR